MKSLYEKRVIIVIPAAERDAENTWVKENVDPDGGEKTFRVPLYSNPDISGNATHYWCSWAVNEAELNLLSPHFGASLYDAEDWSPKQVLTEMVLQNNEFSSKEVKA